MMSRKYFSLAPTYPDRYIPQRQAECLIHFMRTEGTSKDIAKLMGISSRTVESHLYNLKAAFSCYNRKHLAEKAALCNLQNWQID